MSRAQKLFRMFHSIKPPSSIIFCRNKPKRKRDPDAPAKEEAPASSSGGDEELLKEYTGTGRITSSGITVHGHFTEFASQLVPGDAIIITHPIT